MRLDPDVAEALARLRSARLPAFETLTPVAARQLLAQVRAAAAVAGPDLHQVRDIDAGGVPARLYLPCPGALPLMVYVHGGGWVLGGLDSHDAFCRVLATDLSLNVLALDYRLAPEHPFPAGLNDVQTALTWIATGGLVETGFTDLILGGDSAGANLIAVAALTTGQAQRPHITAQVLFCPVTDMRMDHPSHALDHEGLAVTGSTMRWFRQLYCPEADWSNAQLSPLHGPLENAPPTVLITAGCDPLMDEGLDYAGRLARAGRPLFHLHHPGQMHGFMTGTPLVPRVRGMTATIRSAVDDWLPRGGNRKETGDTGK